MAWGLTSIGTRAGNRPAISTPIRRHVAFHGFALQIRPRKCFRGRAVRPFQAEASQPSIVLPLNYAQLLGLGSRELCGESQIQKAHDAIAADTLEPAYSPLAQLGRDKVLFAAREGIRMARGRVRNLSPDIAIEALLLPGALALLEQLGAYDLVVALREAASSTPQLRGASREDEQNWSRDCALALALARCGRARAALDEGSPTHASNEMIAALETLKKASKRGSPLAPDLVAELTSGISAFRSAALVEALQASPSDKQKREAAIADLEIALGGESSPLPSFLGRRGSNQLSIGLPDAQAALATLSVDELARLMDWEHVARDQSAFAWCTEELLSEVVQACIVTGFLERDPRLVETALVIGEAIHLHVDMAVQMATCNVLLGAPDQALDILQEDESIGTGLGHIPRENISIKEFPHRDEVMAWIRSCESGDLLPGLCAFVEKWIIEKAIPSVRERPLTLEPSALGEPSLSAYFEDPSVQAFLSSKDQKPNKLLSWLQKLPTIPPVEEDGVPQVGLLSSVVQQFAKRSILLGAGIAGLLAVVGVGILSSSRQPLPATAIELPTAQSSSSGKGFSGRGNYELKGTFHQGLSTRAAESLIREWLNAKVSAMGPRHILDGLSRVLAEPMLSAVLSEARDAASSGWFWNIQPLKTKASKIGDLAPDGSVTVVASVEEAAELWASNGRKGDSYHTTYQVEYTMKFVSGKWRIAKALVLGA